MTVPVPEPPFRGSRVVNGTPRYFRCVSEGNDLIVPDEGGAGRERFRFPRQRRDRRLCLAGSFPIQCCPAGRVHAHVA